MSVLGPNNTWAFEIYKKADLEGNVTIVVEDGSTVPKTALGKRAAIDHANQLKLIQPNNPDQVYAIMSHLGLKDLVPGIDKSVSACLREQHLYEQWVKGGRVDGVNPLVRFDYIDDDPVHVVQHKMWATADAIRDLMMTDPQAMFEIQSHIWQHQNGAFQQAMLAQGPPPVAGGPPAMPGGPGGGVGGPGAVPSPSGEGAPGGGQAMASANDQAGAANPIAA